MASENIKIERTTIGESLEIPRMVNGLWQLAGGHDQDIDIATAASHMDTPINAGLEAFDMADHYGDAELVIGHHNKTSDVPFAAFTKWCPPETGVTTFENAEAAVDKALGRMSQKSIAIFQYHCWDYSDDTWIHNMCHLRELQNRGKIQHLGLTNTDAAHLKLLLDSGFKVVTNQVPCSLIDRRVTRGPLNEVCLNGNVGLLCYSTLLGGFISEKWLGQPEPADINALNWSLRKYLRFIRAGGGWDAFQVVLRAAQQVAEKHKVGIAAVATRYVLDIPSVKAVIVGTRLAPGSDDYVQRNLKAFTFKLDDEDRAVIAKAQEALTDLPGDCGDEYRRAPFLTATGDLSLHFDETVDGSTLNAAIAEGKRVEYSSGSHWEPIAGYCRAVRTGNLIHVSGTTANPAVGTSMANFGGSSAGSQTVRILDIIENALKALGSCMKDVVRTRIMVEDAKYAEEASRAHGWRFAKCEGTLPANTLVTAGIIGDEMLVEIEAWAEVGSGKNGVYTIAKE